MVDAEDDQEYGEKILEGTPDPEQMTEGYADASDYYNAVSLLREDYSGQLQLASDRQNAILQSIGILVAFASVIFVQKLLSSGPVENDIYLYISDPTFLCCIVGIGTIMMSWKFAFPTGMNVRRSAERFNKGDFKDFELTIVNELYNANLKANDRNRWLNILLILVAALLILGIIKLVAEW